MMGNDISRIRSNIITNFLGTIRGRIIALTSVFLLMLLSFASAVIYQNQKTKNISKKILDFRLPVTLSANSILSGLNRVAASQRAYILTKDETFRKETVLVWERQIIPDVAVLVSNRDALTLKKNRERVDSVQTLISEYRLLQNDIDDYIRQNLMVDETVQLAIDSLNAFALLNNVNTIRGKRTFLDKKIRNKATPLRNTLRNLLQPLASANNKLLAEEINLVNKGIQETNILGGTISFVTFILSILIAYFIVKKLDISIEKSTSLLDRLSLGIIPPPEKKVNDELNAIIISGNKLALNLKCASEFAKQIGDAKFDIDFNPASEKDTLGNSLVKMREKLNTVAMEESKRKWVTEGHAKVGVILREEFEQLDDWYFNIISFVVNYINANQGALYLIENDHNDRKYVSLKSCLAYERKKYMEKKFDINEGLVGQCILEKAHIYLRDIPEGYLNINSGLGDAAPKNLILIPLIANEVAMGVLEIASFKTIDEIQINFLKEISNSVASTVLSVKTNEETKKLLEISREQAEEIQAAEEEMRQNNEELMVTQERLASQEIFMSNQLKAINSSVATIEFGLDGKIKDANAKFLALFGYSLEEIKSKYYETLCEEHYKNSPEFESFWKELQKGNQLNKISKRINKFGNSITVYASYHPQFKEGGNPPSSIFEVAHEIESKEFEKYSKYSSM